VKSAIMILNSHNYIIVDGVEWWFQVEEGVGIRTW